MMTLKKINFFIFTITALLSCLRLEAEIIEVAQFQSLKSYVNQPGTLCLVDIDDTCLIPRQTLGSDVWFIDRWTNYEKSGLSRKQAIDKALSEWEAIRHLTQVKLVEEGTDKVLAHLQEQGVMMMGLTTQGLALATRTKSQLASLGIDLSKTAPNRDQDYYFINEHGVLYRNGILFTSGTAKGPALEKLLELIQIQPQKIVFINDKETHLRDIEKSVEKMGIPFIGLRYSYSDERTRNYNPEIAKIQFERSSFSHILSDQEAEALLNQ